MNVVIFGGSYCSENYFNKVYNFVKNNIKIRDCCIINGGTIGTMEAICKGAKESNIKTIGVVLKKWKKYVNKYVDKVEFYDNEVDRLSYMIKQRRYVYLFRWRYRDISRIISYMDLCNR